MHLSPWSCQVEKMKTNLTKIFKEKLFREWMRASTKGPINYLNKYKKTLKSRESKIVKWGIMWGQFRSKSFKNWNWRGVKWRRRSNLSVSKFQKKMFCNFKILIGSWPKLIGWQHISRLRFRRESKATA